MSLQQPFYLMRAIMYYKLDIHWVMGNLKTDGYTEKTSSQINKEKSELL